MSLLTLALASAPVLAQEDMTPEGLEQRQKAVQNPLTPSDYVTFSISYPVVSLQGFSTRPSVKPDAEAALRTVPWATDVVNQILYIPAEPSIDDLGREPLSILKKAVPQTFPQNRAFIRIKIDEMKVTLVGHVDPGDVKRLEAAIVQINQLPLLRGVDNQVTVRSKAAA